MLHSSLRPPKRLADTAAPAVKWLRPHGRTRGRRLDFMRVHPAFHIPLATFFHIETIASQGGTLFYHISGSKVEWPEKREVIRRLSLLCPADPLRRNRDSG